MATYKEKQLALDVVQGILTENNTDKLKDIIVARIKPHLPFWAKWLPIGRVIDALLPEVLLSVFKDLLTLPPESTWGSD